MPDARVGHCLLDVGDGMFFMVPWLKTSIKTTYIVSYQHFFSADWWFPWLRGSWQLLPVRFIHPYLDWSGGSDVPAKVILLLWGAYQRRWREGQVIFYFHFLKLFVVMNSITRRRKLFNCSIEAFGATDFVDTKIPVVPPSIRIRLSIVTQPFIF